jgi:hypothetical protein
MEIDQVRRLAAWLPESQAGQESSEVTLRVIGPRLGNHTGVAVVGLSEPKGYLAFVMDRLGPVGLPEKEGLQFQVTLGRASVAELAVAFQEAAAGRAVDLHFECVAVLHSTVEKLPHDLLRVVARSRD